MLKSYIELMFNKNSLTNLDIIIMISENLKLVALGFNKV